MLSQTQGNGINASISNLVGGPLNKGANRNSIAFDDAQMFNNLFSMPQGELIQES